MDQGNKNIPTFEELIFAGRNQEYGAYAIRKKYAKTVNRALLVGALVVIIAVLIPVIANALRKSEDEKQVKNVEVVMEDVNKKKEDTPPPPPPPPDTQKEEKTVAFAAPKVVDSVTTQVTITTDDMLANADNAAVDTNSVVVTENKTDEIVEKTEVKQVFQFAEEMPKFPGGEAAMLKWINENVKYPAAARENGVEGNITVSFVVNSDGSISDAQSMRHVTGLQDLEEEAVKVVRQMPKWQPGRQGGKAVNVKFIVPIRFVLNK